MTARVRKAVIPAAGLGTRFLPVTKAQPKEMVPVVDKPAIQYVVEEAVAAGIDDVLIVTSPYKRSIEDHFDRMFELESVLEAKGKTDELDDIVGLATLAKLFYVRQGQALGLGHAVGMAREHVGDEPFAVLLPDDLMVDGGVLLSRMVEIHGQTGGGVVSLMEVAPEEISSYGCADPAAIEGDVVTVSGMVEKPPAAQAPSNLAVTGRYVFPAEIFDHIDAVQPGVGGEIQLTDAMAQLVAGPGLYGCTFTEGRYDVGQKLDYLRATVELALGHPELGEPFAEVLRAITTRQGSGR